MGVCGFLFQGVSCYTRKIKELRLPEKRFCDSSKKSKHFAAKHETAQGSKDGVGNEGYIS